MHIAPPNNVVTKTVTLELVVNTHILNKTITNDHYISLEVFIAAGWKLTRVKIGFGARCSPSFMTFGPILRGVFGVELWISGYFRTRRPLKTEAPKDFMTKRWVGSSWNLFQSIEHTKYSYYTCFRVIRCTFWHSITLFFSVISTILKRFSRSFQHISTRYYMPIFSLAVSLQLRTTATDYTFQHRSTWTTSDLMNVWI